MRASSVLVGLASLFLLSSRLARGQVATELEFEVASVRRVEIPTVNGAVPYFPAMAGSAPRTPTAWRTTEHGWRH
jgi:hypothetical protein